RSRRGCTVPCSSFTAATIPSSQAARPVDLPRPFRTLLASSRFPARGMPMSSPSGAMHSWNAFFSSCEKPRWRWAIEKSVLHKLRFPHDFVAPFSLCCEGGSPFFPPLRRGGRGGGYGTTSHTRFPRSLLLSPFASLSRGEKNRSRPSRLPHHPPYPPFARGGKGSLPPCEGGRHCSLATSLHRAQQKLATRNRPSSSVNPNFSPAQLPSS